MNKHCLGKNLVHSTLVQQNLSYILVFSGCLAIFSPCCTRKERGREEIRGGERRGGGGEISRLKRILITSPLSRAAHHSEGKSDHGSLAGQHANRTECLFLHRIFSPQRVPSSNSIAWFSLKQVSR